jgi:hypothetical protein
MADEPKFPSPEEAKAKRAAEPSSVPTAPARPVIVRRAEPLLHDAEVAAKKEPVKLTQEEVRALLAVTAANRPSTATTLWRRGRIAIIPTGVLQIAAYVVLGGGVTAHVVTVGITIAAIAWTARPLLRKDGWT